MSIFPEPSSRTVGDYSLSPLPTHKVPDPAVSAQALSVTFPNEGGNLRVLEDLSFALNLGEFLCVLGPSGCGKSTLLRTLAGLVQPAEGAVQFAETHYGEPRIGMVFQHANLMPWRTVLANITLPLDLAGVSSAEAYRQAEDLVELVGLHGFASTLPRDLSGGMAQRAALARALIHDPDLLLLDEPFGALDALTRERMGTELLRIWQARRKTVIMVTHSINEAVFLADRVIVLTPLPGRICLDLAVDLPRPRSEEMRYSRRFGELAKKIRSAIG